MANNNNKSCDDGMVYYFHVDSVVVEGWRDEGGFNLPSSSWKEIPARLTLEINLTERKAVMHGNNDKNQVIFHSGILQEGGGRGRVEIKQFPCPARGGEEVRLLLRTLEEKEGDNKDKSWSLQVFIHGREASVLASKVCDAFRVLMENCIRNDDNTKGVKKEEEADLGTLVLNQGPPVLGETAYFPYSKTIGIQRVTWQKEGDEGLTVSRPTAVGLSLRIEYDNQAPHIPTIIVAEWCDSLQRRSSIPLLLPGVTYPHPHQLPTVCNDEVVIKVYRPSAAVPELTAWFKPLHSAACKQLRKALHQVY